MKYIIARRNGEEVPVVFSSSLTHATVASRLGFRGPDLVSAGFVSLDKDAKINCYGKSISLHLRSRPEDSDVIGRELASE
jgi:hypothetical protein